MRQLLLVLAGITVLVSGAGAAEDLLATYEAAKAYDPKLKAAQYEYEAAREAAPQAFAELLPQVSFDFRYTKTNQNILSRDVLSSLSGASTGFSRYQSDSFSFQATQPVFRLTSLIGLDQSKAVVRQAHAQYSAAEQELMVRTAELYLTLLAARDTYEFAQAELAAVAQQRDLVQARRRGGLANVTDEYEAQARHSLVEAAVIEARYGLDDAFQALREVVGDAVSNVVPLKASIPLVMPEPPEISVWMDRALEQNYRLIALKEAETVASDELRKQRALHFPTVDLIARHGNNNQGGSVSTGASDVDSTEVSLQLTVPIFSGGLVTSRTRQAYKNYLRSGEEKKALHRAIMRSTRAAFQGVLTGIRRIAALQASEVSQASVLEGKQKGYRSGVNTLLDMLDAERDLYSIRRDLAVARYTYLLNILRLKQQAGTLSEQDLAYVNSFLEQAVPRSTMVEPAEIGGADRSAQAMSGNAAILPVAHATLD